ncbi:hypothetical protein DTW90_18530 [Neorhizobium sp. P12A]|uniref:hypothetical protein n=1 Tax=Neorhizobium sp. P12A TaxID=2268027 RepID=UPI0011EEF675|nr:hypothetical protein [Neorhizobium sp. P12A]KAA0697428.1 hypothetical protein DTW90_18530 [Neorhizobium sp. P12A]
MATPPEVRVDYPTDEVLKPIPVDLRRELLLSITAVDDQMDVSIGGQHVGTEYIGASKVISLSDFITKNRDKLPAEMDLQIVSTDYGPQGDNWWTCGFFVFYRDEANAILDHQNWTYQRFGQHDKHASVTYTMALKV